MDENPKRPKPLPLLPPQLAPKGGTPYEALGPFGAHYDATMREIHLSGLAAQKKGELTRQRRKAWTELRNTESRLALDLFCLQPDPAVFGEEESGAQGPHEPEPPQLKLPPVEPPSPRAIAKAVGKVPVPPEAESLAPGDPPPLEPSLWALVEEVWGGPDPQSPPLGEPDSFLEEEA